jgi:hypothetical protein
MAEICSLSSLLLRMLHFSIILVSNVADETTPIVGPLEMDTLPENRACMLSFNMNEHTADSPGFKYIWALTFPPSFQCYVLSFSTSGPGILEVIEGWDTMEK